MRGSILTVRNGETKESTVHGDCRGEKRALLTTSSVKWTPPRNSDEFVIKEISVWRVWHFQSENVCEAVCTRESTAAHPRSFCGRLRHYRAPPPSPIRKDVSSQLRPELCASARFPIVNPLIRPIVCVCLRFRRPTSCSILLRVALLAAVYTLVMFTRASPSPSRRAVLRDVLLGALLRTSARPPSQAGSVRKCVSRMPDATWMSSRVSFRYIRLQVLVDGRPESTSPRRVECIALSIAIHRIDAVWCTGPVHSLTFASEPSEGLAIE